MTIPQQIRNGLSHCRSQLQQNQEQIAACVADMARDESVDLTDELERHTAEGDALRRKLAMFENAAAVAVENHQTSYYEVQFARVHERCEAAVEFAGRRTEWAQRLDHLVETFNILKREYEQADEHTRVALWQAASEGLTYQEVAAQQNIDGSCRSSMLDDIAQVLLRYHHEQSLAAAAGAREVYVRQVVTRLQRAESIND